MTIHRFFVDPGTIAGENFPLPPSIANQVQRVLRLRDDGDRPIAGRRRPGLCECGRGEKREGGGEKKRRSQRVVRSHLTGIAFLVASTA